MTSPVITSESNAIFISILLSCCELFGRLQSISSLPMVVFVFASINPTKMFDSPADLPTSLLNIVIRSRYVMGVLLA